jgi:hypothetical protein
MLKQFVASLLFGVFAAGLYGQAPAGVPKGAEETQPGVYRFVDKDKKIWIYRKTPFGIQKSAEDKTESETAAEAVAETSSPDAQPDGARTKTPFGESKEPDSGLPATKITESGDNVTFERPSPFGVYRWTRKKSELTAGERKLWEAQRPVQADKK